MNVMEEIFEIRSCTEMMSKSIQLITDIRALWRSGLSVRVPGCQELQTTA